MFIIHSVWLLSHAIMRTSEPGNVQAMGVTTTDIQLQDAPQDIQAMHITLPDDQQAPKDIQVMDINQPSDKQAPEGSQKPAAAAFLDGWLAGMQDPEQPALQQGGGVKFHNIPTWTAYNSLLSSEKPLTELTRTSQNGGWRE
ncbi:hypothetical protein SK128_001767 [Halocaridina rubra]|uniref:Uncharacterized protein n=1 Tax=Halocaridina rubra TaxID=373956 RepID=A0AAN8WJG0_HALRR